MSSEDPPSAVPVRSSSRIQRKGSSSASSRATPPIPAAPLAPEPSTAMTGEIVPPSSGTANVTSREIMGDSDLTDLSDDASGEEDDKPVGLADGVGSPVPKIPSPRRRSPSPKPRKTEKVKEGQASSSGERKKKSNVIQSDESDAADESEKETTQKKAKPRRPSPRARDRPAPKRKDADRSAKAKRAGDDSERDEGVKETTGPKKLTLKLSTTDRDTPDGGQPKSARPDHQQSRKVSDKPDLGERRGSPLPEPSAATKRKAESRRDDDQEHERRPADRHPDNRHPKNNKRQREEEEEYDTHSDREARRQKKNVRLHDAKDHGKPAARQKNKGGDNDFFNDEYGVKTSQDRGAKTPKTPLPAELVKDHNDVEAKREKKRIKEERRKRDAEVEADDKKVESSGETRPANRRLTSDETMDKVKALSQIDKKARPEPDESDGDREGKKGASSQEVSQLPKKKKRHLGDVPDHSSDVEYISSKSKSHPSDKALKKEDADSDVVALEATARPKLQKRPGEKTAKRVAELAGTGVGARTPSEGKPRTPNDSTPSTRRPGLPQKKAQYDPLAGALSSLVGIGPGSPSGNSTPINRKPVLKSDAAPSNLLTALREKARRDRDKLYAEQVPLNSMSSGLLIQEYENRPKPWRVRANIVRDDVTGKHTEATISAILAMRDKGFFKNPNDDQRW